jgi:hypothetical protein
VLAFAAIDNLAWQISRDGRRRRQWSGLKRAVAVRQQGSEREIAEVRIVGKDALRFFAPISFVAAVFEFLFYGGEGLEEELAVVAEGEGVLAGETASDLMEEDLSEGDIDRRSGLKIADGGEDVRGEEFAVSDATHLAAEMVVAEGGVAWVDGGGAAFGVGAKMSATAAGSGGRRYCISGNGGIWHGRSPFGWGRGPSPDFRKY